MRRPAIERVCFAGVCLLLAVRVTLAAPTALISTGDASPLGLPFSHLSGVALDDRGRVAFVGASTAVFRRTTAGLEHVVGAGDRLGERTIAGVGEPAAGGDCMAVRALFVGGGAAVVRRCGDVAEPIAETGLRLPGGETLAGLGPRVAIGAGGQVAFTATLDGGATGLFAAGAEQTIEIARTGDPAPAGGTFTALRLIGVARNGRTGFHGTVSSGRDGFYVWDGRRVTKIVVVGDASPAGGRFTAFGQAAVNDDEVWALHATIAGRDVAEGGLTEGIFRADAAAPVPALAAVALVGDPSPVGGRFAAIPAVVGPAINAQGLIAFRAGVAGGTAAEAIFLSPLAGSLLRLVGDDVTPAGRLATLRAPVLAGDGSLVLDASLASGTPGLFTVRRDRVEPLALLGEATDLGNGFRFAAPAAAPSAAEAVFLGLQEAVYVAVGRGQVRPVAVLATPTPLGGTYAGFDPPAAGHGRRIVFGADIHGGRVRRALFTVGRRGPLPLVAVGAEVDGGGRIGDLMADPLDARAVASVGPGSVAFQASLASGTATPGLIVRSDGRLRVIARAGDVTPLDGRYVAFGTPAVLGRVRVAFLAAVEQGRGELALFLRRGRVTDALAVVGRRTGTRLEGRFGRLDPPAARADGVVFRAELTEPGTEGIFLARVRRRVVELVVLAGTGDLQPDGGRLARFGAPTFAQRMVVFPVDIRGGARTGGLYAVALRRDLVAQELALARPLAPIGAPSPLGGTFLGFGEPQGNRAGELAFVAELAGASAASAVFLERVPPDRTFP